MSNSKKMVEEITSMDKDFAKWYTDIVKKAGLMDYSGIKGCMILEPYGYAIWENIVSILDKKFKKLGHVNVSMPLLIPESLLEKEKNHIKGFAPEVLWVTHGGNEKLQERFCIRPTSETVFCDYFSKKIHSWRDLPKLYNQWCTVIRWEKSTRPFLRTVEIYWQEGHTAHQTTEEAIFETKQMINVYKDFCENKLCIPVIKGKKTESEKFAGAETTYTIEALMHDGKALQSGTSHYFGDKFSKAYNISFQNKENKPEYVYQTSWGMSSRVIGGIIMTHGDNRGLILPPDIAPIQVIIIPIAMHKEGVLEKAKKLLNLLEKVCRVNIDDSSQTPGWKFSEYEMKGVPIRIEIGPKDIKENKCVVVRRDNLEKIIVPLDELSIEIPKILSNIKNSMYEKASKRLKNMTYTAKINDNMEIFENNTGFIKAPWCGDTSCEDNIKEKTAFTSRCISSDDLVSDNDKCICCKKKAKHILYFAKSY